MEKRGDTWNKARQHGRRAVLLQLVAAGLAADGGGERGFLHTDPTYPYVAESFRFILFVGAG